jgi:hypothetical protein
MKLLDDPQTVINLWIKGHHQGWEEYAKGDLSSIYLCFSFLAMSNLLNFSLREDLLTDLYNHINYHPINGAPILAVW